VIARLQESDIPVFDLGDTRGVATMRQAILSLGGLLNVEGRASQLTRRTDRELSALRQAVPLDQRRDGMYLSVYGDGFFGGTTRTSFDDMLDLAGIDDIAAKHGYVEWPQYMPEQLLTMNPALIITPEGMGAAICGHSILHALMACSPDGQIVEVSTEYISDPGLGLIHAAAAIQLAVHPEEQGER
jgi:ABC-type Fe3+-hydroxamate transport system substrate-binding protein